MDWYCAFEGRLRGPHTRASVEGLLRSGLIDRETKVWREGMPRWRALGSVDDFRGLLPPPVPGEPEPARGGPWSRCCARLFDLTLLAVVIVFLIEAFLPALSMEAFLLYANARPFVTGSGIVASAFALNALVLTAFGNSPGKALFGLRAVPLDGAGRFGFAGHAAREFRVWVFGAGIGIPVVALVTMARNYREVGAGRPASYDRRHARMEARPIGETRRTVAMISVAGLSLAAVALVVWGEPYERRIAAARMWANPVSGLSATLPAGWIAAAATRDDGVRLFTFTAFDRSKTVYLAVEEDAGGLTLGRYAELVARNAAASATLIGRWRRVEIEGAPMLRRDGWTSRTGRPVTLLLAKHGNRFWRLIVMGRQPDDHGNAEALPLVKALVATLA